VANLSRQGPRDPARDAVLIIKLLAIIAILLIVNLIASLGADCSESGVGSGITQSCHSWLAP
jgi:hypothetical protein